MEMKTFYEFLRQLSPLSDDFVAYLEASISVQQYMKGERLVGQTQITHKTWFVYSGLLKSCYFDQSGRQIITRFYREQELILINSGDDSDGKTRAREEIILLEDCTLFSINSQQLQYIFENFDESHRITRRIYLIDSRKKDLRSRLLVMPAAEAYVEFCRHFPCQRMLLQDIAYYLNIRPYSLSRIRKRK